MRLQRVSGWVAATSLAAALFVSNSLAGPSAAAGRELYETNGCIICHGLYGKGDGGARKTLHVKPADLRALSKFKRGSTVAAIARTLKEGIEVEHYWPELGATHHYKAMPSFSHLTNDERRSLALYIISLSKPAK
jgi:mono/diheme cytochrome c family protein